MVLAARTWASFKIIRIFIFSLSTLACMVCTALYTFLLIRGWSSFLVGQRAIILVLIAIYGISSIISYLMIVVLSRPWMDGARVAFLVLFQVGGTVTFFIFRPSFPCNNIGPQFTCKATEDIVIFGGWSLSGLLSIYAFFLVIMSYVPVPPPPPNAEAALAVNISHETFLEKEKRRSAISVDSHYSQPSFIDHNRRPPITSSARMSPNYTPTSVRSTVPSIHYPTRAPSITSPSRMRNYRPGTPGSVRSTTISRSSTQDLTNPRYNSFHPSRVPTPASSIRSSLSLNAQPPNQPISMQGSVVSYHVPLAINSCYDPSSSTPSGLTLGVQGWKTSQPLTYGSNMSAPPLVQPFSATLPLRIASPGIRPTHVEGSIHMSSRSGSVLSVPRSATPMSAVLPAHPGLPVSLYNRRRVVNEVRRYVSVPDVGVNDAPTYHDSHYRSDFRRAPINNFAVRGNNEQHANVQKWRRDLIYNATK